MTVNEIYYNMMSAKSHELMHLIGRCILWNKYYQFYNQRVDDIVEVINKFARKRTEHPLDWAMVKVSLFPFTLLIQYDSLSMLADVYEDSMKIRGSYFEDTPVDITYEHLENFPLVYTELANASTDYLVNHKQNEECLDYEGEIRAIVNYVLDKHCGLGK